ncbi:hypothetical protein CPLU01_12743 [Colletotrichum plurivorum]|uniref:Uncharacterized protein n=1 Tax=Colletotrichum plurivorum TaxID=2175906 RepID=A0A8H6JVZ2_9PEZI|nr:hypothetical protein CPLU01_12743 [Colletotrichum plurivorum]
MDKLPAEMLSEQIYEKLRRMQRLCGKKVPWGQTYPEERVASFRNLVAKAGLSEKDAPLANDCIGALGSKERIPFPERFYLGVTPMSGFMYLFIFDMYREEGRLHVCRFRGNLVYSDGPCLPEESPPVTTRWLQTAGYPARRGSAVKRKMSNLRV